MKKSEKTLEEAVEIVRGYLTGYIGGSGPSLEEAQEAFEQIARYAIECDAAASRGSRTLWR
jgi:hypothetical protein